MAGELPGAAARALTDPTRVAMLLEGASFPAALWSGSYLRFTWMNEVFRDLLEDVHPQWDLLGMPVRGFLSDSCSATHFIDVAYTGQPVTGADYEFRASWGETTYWQLSYLPLPGLIGHPFDVLFIAVDASQAVADRASEEVLARELRRAMNLIDVTVLSSLDAEDILQRVLVEATEALGADWGWIAEREDRDWVFRNVHGWPTEMTGLRFGEDELSLPALVSHAGRVVVASRADAKSLEHVELMNRHGVGAFALVPLKRRGDVTGVMGFCWDADLDLGDARQELLHKLELSLSLALENARQFETERQLTRQLRGTFFSVPRVLRGFEMGHLYHAATGISTVGGDFYDVVPLSSGQLGVLIGDVSGHGFEAAGLTSLVKSAMRSEALKLPSPQLVMDHANELVIHGAEPNEFVSAFFGLIDGQTGDMVYSLAGHPPPVIVRADGSQTLLPNDGGVLGVIDHIRYTNHDVHLGVGDMLVMYTDGLIEARSPVGEQYGTERLVSACAVAASESAEKLPEALFLSAFSFAEGHLSDDIAIVALRRGPSVDGFDQGRLELEPAVA
ncbi:MAG: SpoIIE family protein phosphatase [Coriobacteriia bacterium]|nr:SpoIIE family protein phosphatase [Coriobacteriia bacterium]